jgi:hypothetical protein
VRRFPIGEFRWENRGVLRVRDSPLKPHTRRCHVRRRRRPGRQRIPVPYEVDVRPQRWFVLICPS